MQPKTLCGTGYLSFGNSAHMRKVDKPAFAGRVRARIERLKTNPTAVAKALGLRQQTVDNVVQGKVGRPGFIVELARVLCTTTDWLLWDEGAEEIEVPFSPEEILAIAKRLRSDQRGLAVTFLKTLAEKDSKAA